MTTPRPRPSSRRMPDRPGLQAERTELAWERSSIGLLAAAALLMFRHVEPMTPGRVVLAAADVGLALVVAWLGRRRGRQVRAHRAGVDAPGWVPIARREVLAVSVGAIAVAAGTALLIAFGT